MKRILPISLMLSCFATAQAAELKLSGPEIQNVLTDKTLFGTDHNQPAEQIFQKSGATFYSSGGSQSQGAWKIEGDKYCSQWPPNQAWPCYDVTKDGDKITFISASGARTEMSLVK